MYRYKKLRLSSKETVDEHRVVAGAVGMGYHTVVHHRDENKRNNTPENLEIMTRSEHCKLHGFGVTIRPTKIFGPTAQGTGVCRTCGQEKAFADFQTNRTWSHGKSSQCLACYNSYRAEWRRNRAKVAS